MTNNVTIYYQPSIFIKIEKKIIFFQSNETSKPNNFFVLSLFPVITLQLLRFIIYY